MSRVTIPRTNRARRCAEIAEQSRPRSRSLERRDIIEQRRKVTTCYCSGRIMACTEDELPSLGPCKHLASIPTGSRIIMSHIGITRRNVLTLGGLAALGAWPAHSQPVDQPGASSVEARRSTFDEVWETVRDRFYDRDLHGLDWPAVRRRYQPLAASADSGEQLAVVINTMLAELRTSHTQYYTPEGTSVRCASRPGSHLSIGRGRLSWHRRIHERGRSAPHCRHWGRRGHARSSGGSSYRR